MTEEQSLRQTILHELDSDLPRLIYSDWLEEAGQVELAQFIRLQCRLAEEPIWSTLSQHCQYHAPAWINGAAWWETLPQLGSPQSLCWHPTHPFERGFGTYVQSHFIPALQSVMPRLIQEQPIQKLSLGTAIREQWITWAESPWLQQIRSISFDGMATPIEAIEQMKDCPYLGGLREIRLSHCVSPAMGELLERIQNSPMHKTLRKLYLGIGNHNSQDWYVPLCCLGQEWTLEELSVERMPIDVEDLPYVFRHLGLLKGLRSLNWTGSRLTPTALAALLPSVGGTSLEVLSLRDSKLSQQEMEVLANSPLLTEVKYLDLSSNPLGWEGVRFLAKSPYLQNVKALNLRLCGVDDRAVRYLKTAKFWPKLVSLDLSRNPIGRRGCEMLMSLTLPAELTVLALSLHRLNPTTVADLQNHFQTALIDP